MAAQTNRERVYQDGSRYHLPMDAPEQERLKKQAQSLLALMNDRPIHAPLSTPKKILDVGCGTGAMTDLLGTTFAEAHVYGVDLAPVPESKHNNVENVEYVQGDIRELIGVDPRFEPGSFDYIFQRLFVCVGLNDWPKYVEQIASLAKPGGWLEFHEVSMQLRGPAEEPLAESMSWFQELKVDATEVGMDIELGDHIREIFESTPILENVEQSVYPFAPAPEEDKPRLYALQQQIPQLFAVITQKVSGSRRGKAEAERISNDMKSTWERGFEPGTHFQLVAVTGQKK